MTATEQNQTAPFLIDSYTGDLPIIELVGRDGNAFSIIGRVMSAWNRLKRRDIATEFQSRATEGDYNNLLRMAVTYSREEDVELDEDEDDDEEEIEMYDEEGEYAGDYEGSL